MDDSKKTNAIEEELALTRRMLKRERQARKQAELLLEQKSLVLFESQKDLARSFEEVNRLLNDRTELLQKQEQLQRKHPFPVLQFDDKSRLTYANDAAEILLDKWEIGLSNIAPSPLQEYISHALINGDGHYEETIEYLSSSEIRTFYMMLHRSEDQQYINIYGHDITNAKKLQIRLAKSEEKYRRIIDNMQLGLLEVDTDGRIIAANDRFCKMVGYSHQELEGKQPEKLILEHDFNKTVADHDSIRKTGSSSVYEVQVRTKSGELIWLLISGAPLFNDDHEVVGSIGIHLDITSHKNLEVSLKEANERALKLVEAKKIFLANMSHEIRTPMNAVLGMSKLLANTQLTAKQQKYLSAINASAENLLVIINDILDFSKIEADQVSLEKIGFLLPKVTETVINTLMMKAEEKGLRLLSTTDNAIHPVLIGDPSRLYQILLNLTNNAIKFTEYGEISIQIKVLVDSPDEQTIEMKVIDTGIGIDESQLINIFDSFTQEDASVTRKYGGTGLGLAITQKLIALFGGALELTSHKGKGTTFTLVVAFPKGNETDLPDQHNTDNVIIGHDLKDLKVLLVEDNEINRYLATTILETWGMHVHTAHHGKKAIDMLMLDSYDIVLMDMQMPEMDGLEATRVIRAQLRNPVPIIALTANAIKGDQERCLEAGMNDYVSKPFKEEELYTKIAKQCHIAINQKDTYTVVSSHTATTIQHQQESMLYDLSKLEQTSHGNKAFVKRMVDLFISHTPESLDKLQDAYQAKEWELVKNVAHTMKPSLDMLHIEQAAKYARQIEKYDSQDISEKALGEIIQQLQTLLGMVIQQLRERT